LAALVCPLGAGKQRGGAAAGVGRPPVLAPPGPPGILASAGGRGLQQFAAEIADAGLDRCPRRSTGCCGPPSPPTTATYPGQRALPVLRPQFQHESNGWPARRSGLVPARHGRWYLPRRPLRHELV